MRDIEFLSFITTPEEKYLGIATVMYDHTVILSYKIHLGKEGEGFYITRPSFKDPVTQEWRDWHSIDSRIKHKNINDIVRNNIKSLVDKAIEERDKQHVDLRTGELYGV